MTPSTTSRAFRVDDDWWRIRDFILDTYRITPVGFLWENRRWEGWRYHREQPVPVRRLHEVIRIWESSGRIVGVANPEGRGEICLQVHPDFRHLESDMLAWAEDRLARPGEDGKGQTIATFTFDYDSPRQQVLIDRGWNRLESGGMTRHLHLGDQHLQPTPQIDGYVLRSTRSSDRNVAQRMADVLDVGFGRDTHSATELHTFMAKSPTFRHDLNLIAETSNGSFAAHVGGTYDERNRRGIIEPVCTDPRHRRRGLAQALILEMFQRFKDIGVTDVFVDTGDDEAANDLYESAGFTEAYHGNIWRKTW
ncbi:MAG: GNAT family N-acetyltransferase [Acidimicrobiia bacterium]